MIDNRNERERFEAMKFMRRFSKLYPQQIPPSFIYAVDSIVSASYNNNLSRLANPMFKARSDLMIKCSLEFLCEIGKTSEILVFVDRSFDRSF